MKHQQPQAAYGFAAAVVGRWATKELKMTVVVREARSPMEIAVLHAAELAEQGKCCSEQDVVAKWNQVADAHFLVAALDVVVAFLGYQTSKGTTCYISDLYVSPTYRRKGIARKLIVDMKRRYDRVELYVAQNNRPALELYRSEGFEVVSSMDDAGKMKMIYTGAQHANAN